MRLIVGALRFAWQCDRPSSIGKGRVRGVKALGVRYENSLAKAMPFAKQGQWFEFGDKAGTGVCQVDLIWIADGFAWVCEVKHSWVAEAELKLKGLYCPIVAEALGMPTKALVACKLLRPGARNIHGTLAGAMNAAKLSDRIVPTWQWFGGMAVQLEHCEAKETCHGEAQLART